MSLSFINHNGQLCSSREKILTASNRAFKYGDGLFESMRFMNGKINYLDLHIERLRKGMKLLKMESWSSVDSWFLKDKVEELCRRNKHGADARVRLTVYRDADGLYSPDSNKFAYLLESSDVTENYYKYNERGLIIDVYEELTKPINILSNLKTCNALVYVMAGIYKNQHALDEVAILNQNGFLCESLSSNIFIGYKQKLYTPSLYEGCIGGVMRQVVMKLAKENDIEIIEGQINPDILNAAEEVFLSNAARGIQWVMGFNNKRYFNEMSRFLSMKLMEADHSES